MIHGDIFDGSSHLSTIRDPQVIDGQMVFGTGFDTEILRDSPAMVRGALVGIVMQLYFTKI